MRIPGGLKVGVIIVGNLSLTTRESVLKIMNKWHPDFNEFLNDIKIICDERSPRIYWRISKYEFTTVRNYLDLKTALTLMFDPRIYLILEEPLSLYEAKISGQMEEMDFAKDSDSPIVLDVMPDLEILRFITSEQLIPKNSKSYSYFSDKRSDASVICTCEYRDVYRKLKILVKALSLLCVRSSSGSTAMLEAPPGSREDLVEAARIPCTQPTDLDAMLYGYTNSIYVLDHAQESLPDMDMLQLFASPAGRALVMNEPQAKGTTLTSSLSRESSSRSKNGRRTSATGTASAPASPPRHRKSSAELYKEAAEILGLTCSMTDSCRCIDCQSNYFDCEEDYGDTRTEVAAGTPILHALSHPLTCTIQ